MVARVKITPSCSCAERTSKHAKIMEINLDRYEKHLLTFQDALLEGEAEVVLTRHEGQREIFRAISRNNVLETVKNGWAIEAYSQGGGIYDFRILYHLQIAPKTYRPIHIYCSLDSKINKLSVITVYDPRSMAWKWSKNFTERVCFCERKDSYV